MVGLVSTAIDIVLLRLLHQNFGVALWLSVALAFFAGTINGYWMNSRWTFGYNTKGREAVKFTQFATVSLIGLGLTEVIVNYYAVSINQSINLFGQTLSAYLVGKLIAVMIVFFWNFFANKFWTFKAN